MSFLVRSFFFIFTVTRHLLCRRQDGLEERRAVEVDQIVDTLADADELDRNAETGRDGDDDTALGGAVELGEDDAGQLGRLVELLGLMDGVLDMVPGAKISVVGLYRNEETLEPVEYYVKLAKEIDQRIAIILDPMLATGGSLIAAIDLLKKRGCKQILSLNLVCAPEGIRKVEEAHPDVDIYTASVDSHLNEHGYIIPGLGDAGDRIFGTR